MMKIVHGPLRLICRLIWALPALAHNIIARVTGFRLVRMSTMDGNDAELGFDWQPNSKWEQE